MIALPGPRAEIPGRAMSLKRRSYEAGHKPKYLVVIDESPECDRAVYYASRRAARTGASLVMLLVIEPHDRHQQWLGVADIMKAEAHEAANQRSTSSRRAPTASPASRRSG